MSSNMNQINLRNIVHMCECIPGCMQCMSNFMRFNDIHDGCHFPGCLGYGMIISGASNYKI